MQKLYVGCVGFQGMNFEQELGRGGGVGSHILRKNLRGAFCFVTEMLLISNLIKK